MTTLNKTIARKVLKTVDAGLTSGVGNPKPGEMCVMAAINYAMGNKHGDEPDCVHPVIRAFDIALNDAKWSSNEARARGMRREAIAKLGSTEIDGQAWLDYVVSEHIKRVVPIQLKVAAKLIPEHSETLLMAAKECEEKGTESAAGAAAKSAKSAESAAWSAAGAAKSAASAVKSAKSAKSAAKSAKSAESAAWSAESAAWSAESAAWSAESAESAAKSAAGAAESAAWSAESAAWSAESAKSAKSAKSAESAAWSAAKSAKSAAKSAKSAESAAWSAAKSAKSATHTPDEILTLSATIAEEACIKFGTQGSKWMDILEG